MHSPRCGHSPRVREYFFNSHGFGAVLRNHIFGIGALAVMSMTGSALAADMAAVPAPVSNDQWLLTLGIGPEVVPQFPGAKTYTVVPNGQISRWRAGEPEPFIAPDDGFTVAVIDLGSFKAGPVARFLPSRGLSDGNGNFAGLHNVDWTLELGGFFEFWAADVFRTHVEVRQAVNGHHGLEANVALDAVQRFGAWTFSAGPRVGYGDDKFMNAYFSITPAEAAANGIVSPYMAHSSFDMVGGLVTARYDLSRSWNVTVYGGYNRLVGDAGVSPISLKLGTRDEFTGGATIAYTFAWGGLGLGFLGL